MNQKKAGKRVNILFYLLTFYILLQFFWWAYLLVKLNIDLYQTTKPEVARLKIWMIVGEGSVFFIFLIVGFYFFRRTIKKEIFLVRQQHNFLLSITHELKTPLAAIKLSLDTLDKHEALGLEDRQMLKEHVRDNTTRLGALIDNVLLATRLENERDIPVPNEINFSEVTQTIVSRMGKGFIEGHIKHHIEPNIIGFADLSNYESIVINLIENALKYGADKPIFTRLTQQNKKLILEVSDHGPGVPHSFKSKIFDKFYRTENEEIRSKKGTGLGLYIVKNLVEHNGGRVYLQDNQPTGSTFIVELPLNEPPKTI